MPLQVDDMKVGQWVAIIQDDSRDARWNLFGPIYREPSLVDGCPLQILAINPPFIIVYDGHGKFPIDCRTVVFTKVDRKYVQTALGDIRSPRGSNANPNSGEARPPRLCPNCEEGSLVQRFSKPETGWMLVCPVCKFQGKVPKAK